MPTVPRSEFKDQDLAHVHTQCGGDLQIKRTSSGRLRYTVRTGPTDPITCTYPIAELTAAEFQLVLQAEQASALNAIAEAFSPDVEASATSSLACIAIELNAARTDSTAVALLSELRQLRRALTGDIAIVPPGACTDPPAALLPGGDQS